MPRRLLSLALSLFAALALLAVGALSFGWLRAETDPELCAALTQQRLTHVYLSQTASLSCARVKVQAATPALNKLLAGNDAAALSLALSQDKGSALAIAASDKGRGLQAKLARYGLVQGLRAVTVGPELSVYTANPPTQLSTRERDALAYVARALLRGAREPSVNSFPPALRRVERVEVMVLLREHGEPRLWRSARGTSLARGLLTATRVARDRWREVEARMGGPLAQRLLDLDVEVTLLQEDGTLLSTERSFVERAVGAEHALGYEYLSGWHYLLPADMARRGKGSAYAALTALLGDQGLSPAVLAESALRAYRLVAETLGVSRAPLAAPAGDDASPG